jgi:hypothetical protein
VSMSVSVRACVCCCTCVLCWVCVCICVCVCVGCICDCICVCICECVCWFVSASICVQSVSLVVFVWVSVNVYVGLCLQLCLHLCTCMCVVVSTKTKTNHNTPDLISDHGFLQSERTRACCTVQCIECFRLINLFLFHRWMRFLFSGSRKTFEFSKKCTQCRARSERIVIEKLLNFRRNALSAEPAGKELQSKQFRILEEMHSVQSQLGKNCNRKTFEFSN